MPANSKVLDASAFRSLVAFKPRQVQLLSSKQDIAMKHESGKPLSMSKDQKALLLKSICLYLENNGFSKTLKKFRSEAEIEKDSWKSCSLALEEVFLRHLQACNDASADNTTTKGQVGLGDATVHKVDNKAKHAGNDDKSNDVDVPTKMSKEKKKKDKLAGKSLNEESESRQKATEVKEGIPMGGSNEKSKTTNGSETNEKQNSEEKTKSKSKKKKQDAINPDDSSVGTKEVTKLENSHENEIEKGRKSSKKRKSNSSEAYKQSHDEAKQEDSKRRKTNNSVEQVMEVKTSCANGNIGGGENADQQTPHGKTPANGIMAKQGEEKSSTQRSSKKKQTDSAELKSLNAFQRVKADEIEFADERLQDNSYWAKDGADSGYGAKAQEVLGQVRGRDFRHEKTKKKRGSYRGGQIDLNSHSVKFVYDQEDDE